MDNLINNTIYNPPKQKPLLKKAVALYIVIVLILIGVGVGILIGQSFTRLQVVTEPDVVTANGEEYGKVTNKTEPLPEYFKNDVDFSLFWEIWNKIQTEYVEKPVGETRLLYGAVAGLVNALDDPYSIFLEPEPAKEFTNDLSGKFEGIGAEIGIRDDLLTIISPLSESPAEKAGLKAKDRVMEIDGASTKDMSLNEAVLNIRGEKGTTVVLKVFRESDNEFHEISIVRNTIKIASVKWEMKDDIAYIKITNFNSDTDSRFKQAVDELLLNNPKGVILDLRSNPGGYLDRAVDIASYWIEQGKVVVKEEFADKNDNMDYLAQGNAQLKNYPTIVLVNLGSASGSEIVAGALQDYGIATLVGETTFGKGSVQGLEEFFDGSAVKLTVARWLTPNGRQINVIGIDPDEVIELTEEDWDAERDPQLDRAIELLSQ